MRREGGTWKSNKREFHSIFQYAVCKQKKKMRRLHILDSMWKWNNRSLHFSSLPSFSFVFLLSQVSHITFSLSVCLSLNLFFVYLKKNPFYVRKPHLKVSIFSRGIIDWKLWSCCVLRLYFLLPLAKLFSFIYPYSSLLSHNCCIIFTKCNIKEIETLDTSWNYD